MYTAIEEKHQLLYNKLNEIQQTINATDKLNLRKIEYLYIMKLEISIKIPKGTCMRKYPFIIMEGIFL